VVIGIVALAWPLVTMLALVAVTDLIPMVGATIGAVVCIAVALLATRLWPTTVLLAAFFVAYQQLENYVLAPRIMRRPVQLSPAAVLLAGLIGGAALGLIGALMAIPTAAGGKVLLSERLKARDAATDAAAPGAGNTALQPGQTAPHAPPADTAQPPGRRRQSAAQDGDQRNDPAPG
jgi:predicted PurR-regulated permease PerM